MNKLRRRTLWWTLLTLYLASIYATLGIMPAVWSRINTIVRNKIVCIVYAAYFGIAIALISYMRYARKRQPVLKQILLLLFIAIIFVMVKMGVTPAEKIHTIQYGIVGIIVYNALKVDFDRVDPRLYLIGALVCTVAGALDEYIQWLLPNRYFGWNDVFTNGASGILILLIIRYTILDLSRIKLRRKRR